MSRVDPIAAREAVVAVAKWLHDRDAPDPGRDAVARAVRLTARLLAARAPGSSVEVRIPPLAAVQCVSGPRHTRGTPPNTVETDPRTWLLLATGLIRYDEVAADGRLSCSGSRAAEIAAMFPLVSLPATEEP